MQRIATVQTHGAGEKVHLNDGVEGCIGRKDFFVRAEKDRLQIEATRQVMEELLERQGTARINLPFVTGFSGPR